MAGPLDQAELRAIESALSEGSLDKAQLMLAGLDPNRTDPEGLTYLTTRLLYQRGKLRPEDAAQRVGEVLAKAPHFTEARQFLGELPKLDGPVRTLTPGLRGTQRDEPAFATPAGRSSTPIPGPSSVIPQRPPSVAPSVRPQAQRHETPPLGSASQDRQAREADEDGVPAILSPISDLTGLSSAPPESSPRGAPLIPRAPNVPDVVDGARARRVSAPPISVKPALPAGAGRYSEAPRSTESIRPRTSERTAARSGAPQPPPSSKSRGTLPPAAKAAFAEAERLLDESRYDEALEVLDATQLKTPRALAYAALLRSQAFAGLEFRQQALSELTLLEQDPSLEAEHRAHGAELLARMGDYDRAITQAVKALETGDDSSNIRLHFAAVVVLASRHRDDDFLVEQANRALSHVRVGDDRARLMALRACLVVRGGNADRALQLATEALSLDADNTDALAALAEAACQKQDFPRARHALQRLSGLALAEAQALRPRLGALGLSQTQAAFAPVPPSSSGSRVAMPPGADVTPSRSRAEARPNIYGGGVREERISVPPVSATPGGTAKHNPSAAPEAQLQRCVNNLVAGNRGAALEILRTLARERTSLIPRVLDSHDPAATATAAATFLTRAPVFSSFVPYDLSLWSVARLEAALDTLLGKGPWPQKLDADDPLLTILGSYLGETLRQAHQGRWSEAGKSNNRSRVVVGHRGWEPFDLIVQRFRHGDAARIRDAIPSALLNPGSDPYNHRIPNPVAPPLVGGVARWPSTDALPALAKEFASGVVGLFTSKSLGIELDQTLDSLRAIERYLALLAPAQAPSDPDGAWAEPVALMVGAYLGEVACQEWSAAWEPAGGQQGLDQYRVNIDGRTASPMLEVVERIGAKRGRSVKDRLREALTPATG